MAGLDIAIISRQALTHTAPGNLVELDAQDFPFANSRHWVLPKGKHESVIAKAFREHVAKVIT